jgi:poly(hydroxyalkanoate) depolymerase family esterase
MNSVNRAMQEAMELMQTGNLHAATRAIQRTLQARHDGRDATKQSDASATDDPCIEGQYRVVTDAPNSREQTRPMEPRERGGNGSQPAGTFLNHRFSCDVGTMDYKLFIPSGLCEAPPLVVMLHGCTQTPDDFARGTRMNALAQEHGYVVAYPAQAQSKNSSKCWNWFRSQDQKRGQGEPALIAALTRHLANTHALDERRLYVTGLSAGGAMAAVLGSTYPDVFAAIGVHSGLPCGVARDLPSALAAMKKGASTSPTGVRAPNMNPVPAIVFHGDRDATVDPCNGEAVIAQCVGTDAESGAARPTVELGSVPGGRSYTRNIFRNPDGSVTAEQWVVHGAGHAWFGGDPAGSYTDPSGPDASKLMLRFFSGYVR